MHRNYRHIRIFRYSDSGYAGDRGDRKTTTGYYTFVGGNLMTWRSKKQDAVSRSSAKAEIDLWLMQHARWCGHKIY